jgi:hypothetical protein
VPPRKAQALRPWSFSAPQKSTELQRSFVQWIFNSTKCRSLFQNYASDKSIRCSPWRTLCHCMPPGVCCLSAWLPMSSTHVEVYYLVAIFVWMAQRRRRARYFHSVKALRPKNNKPTFTISMCSGASMLHQCHSKIEEDFQKFTSCYGKGLKCMTSGECLYLKLHVIVRMYPYSCLIQIVPLSLTEQCISFYLI